MGIFSLKPAKSFVGLDISTNAFRVAQLKPTPQKPTLVNYGSVSVPVGAVVEGEVVDVEAASQAIASLWKKTGLLEKRVTIGVANQKVVVRLIELPFIEKAELKGAIRYQAQDFIPIPVEEAIMDFQILREFTTEGGEKMIEVLLVAAQKDMIQNNITAAEKAGLRPEAIDVSSFAVVRSLVPTPVVVPEEEEVAREEGALALVDIGSGTTNIVVVEKNVARFTRVSSVAGNVFSEALVEQLGLTIDEAEELKPKIGLPPPKGKKTAGVPKELADKAEGVHQVLSEEVKKFVAEVRRSLDYYLAQTPQAKGIEQVILSGSEARLKNFPAHLEKGLGLKVELGRPLQKVQPGRKLNEEQLETEELSMAICVGLALRELE